MLKKRVILGMSGGVDSSVSASLLKDAGYEVIALFMKNWQDDENCPAAQDFRDVAKVAEALDIPYYSVNFEQAYQERVFKRFLDDLKRGLTPNPDVFCNQEIKFKVFFEKAKDLDADFIATGHYARIDEKGGVKRLARALDSDKDQSYFLHRISGDVLSRTLFPIGDMRKSEVRSLAAKKGLCVASKRDSTGICFIGKRSFPDFIGNYLEKHEGPMMTLDGKVLGHHEGLFNYTLGQRKGLGIGGIGSNGLSEPWFVAGKDLEKNILYVVQGEDHPALYTTELIASEESWIHGPPPLPYACTAKIRYRSSDVVCRLERGGQNRLLVQFESPVKAATAGQSIVFYDGPICLGGAIIEKSTSCK